MATWFSSLKINGSRAEQVKQYGPHLDDATWRELHEHARQLSLSNLSQLYYVYDFVFNPRQSHDILSVEIPALRTQRLSLNVQKFLDGLEHAIQDMYTKNHDVFLYFEGD